MLIQAGDAIQKANRLLREHETRNPDRLAEQAGITVMERNFKKQKGVYMVIERNRFIFIKADLDPVMRPIVLLHEIGHDTLHRKAAAESGGFQEFNIFDMRNNRMEYEANLFAAQISLPNDEILEYILRGWDVGQIAAMNSDINLVALKAAELNQRGYRFRRQEYRSSFLLDN